MPKSKELESYGILFILLVLFTPYFITNEILLGGSRLRVLFPLWGLLLTGVIPQFEIPLGLSYDYFVFWGLGCLYVLVVLQSINKIEGLTNRNYLIRVSFVLFLQICAYAFTILRLGGGNPITIIPLPIPAIVALLLTPRVAKKRIDLWDSSSTSSE